MRSLTMNGETASPIEYERELVMEEMQLLKSLVWLSMALPALLLTLGIMVKLQD